MQDFYHPQLHCGLVSAILSSRGNDMSVSMVAAVKYHKYGSCVLAPSPEGLAFWIQASVRDFADVTNCSSPSIET